MAPSFQGFNIQLRTTLSGSKLRPPSTKPIRSIKWAPWIWSLPFKYKTLASWSQSWLTTCSNDIGNCYRSAKNLPVTILTDLHPSSIEWVRLPVNCIKGVRRQSGLSILVQPESLRSIRVNRLHRYWWQVDFVDNFSMLVTDSVGRNFDISDIFCM